MDGRAGSGELVTLLQESKKWLVKQTFKSPSVKTGEMAQWLAFAALPEDWSSVPSPHVNEFSQQTAPPPGDPVPNSGLLRHPHTYT